MKPLISVIIPVFNAENYLYECFNSILKQTLGNIEIICINDGSTDKSIDIINYYVKKDKRIILYNQQNKGSGLARNVGIKTAIGEYICFMDADDYYPENNTLEKLYAAIKTNNVFICGGSMCIFNTENKTKITEFNDDYYGFVFKKNKKIKYSEYQFDFGYQRFLFNRKFLIKNNILFPNYKRFQDPPFFVRSMIMAKEFYSIVDIVYMYRDVEKNKIFFNHEKCIDIIKGIIDNLDMAIKEKLYTLYNLTINRLLENSNYFIGINNLDFLELLFKVYSKLIKYSEVEEVNNNFCNYLYSYIFDEKELIKDIQSSFSFRLGRFLTWLPRYIIINIIKRKNA